MKIGDEVLILKKASVGDYYGWVRWVKDKNALEGTRGYIGRVEGDAAYVTPHRLPHGADPVDYDGWWWKLRDLQIIEPDKWRRQRCG